jgi:NADPH-dependent glutamate synthase beta subunit-like oxidoreductase
VAVEVARTARRLAVRGAKVSVVCYEAPKGSRPERPEEEIQAEEAEIAEAVQEGVVFHPGFGPRRIIGEGGRVAGLELAPVVALNYDKEGRYKPVFGQNGSTIMEADTVFLAVEREADLSFLQGRNDLLKEIEQSGAGVQFVASREGVFFCGDMAGTCNVVEAVASGQRAAQAIHSYLGGKGSLGLGGPRPVVPVPHHEKGDTFARRLTIGRILPPAVPVSDRLKGMGPVEGIYSDKVARKQGDRCLDCAVSPMIGPYHPCTACGDCLDVCPTECLALRFMNQKDLSSENGSIEEAEGEGPWVGLIIDEGECVHCGACAEACWSDAIHMVRFKEMEG